MKAGMYWRQSSPAQKGASWQWFSGFQRFAKIYLGE